MYGLLALILFFGMWSSGFSDDSERDCIFDWESFAPNAEYNNLVLDFRGLKIAAVNFDGRTYNELVGQYKVNQDIDDTYDVTWTVEKHENGNRNTVLKDTRDYDYFVDNVYTPYLSPITRDNYVNSVDPFRTGTYSIRPAEDKEELAAPSRLDEGKYYLHFGLLQKGQGVGGLSGNFTVLYV